jgi:HPt (histidine-containing phosphotransfer) domain-containing protein
VGLQGELYALRKAIDSKDYATISRIAHIYITALKYIGAFALAELTSSIELTIVRNEHNNTSSFDDQLETLHEEITKMKAKIKTQVSSI